MWLEFRCSVGKSRVKGARPAYEWALPDLGLLGFSLTSCLLEYLEQVHPRGATYRWPALDLRASDLWQLSDDTGLLNRRMSGQQLVLPGLPLSCSRRDTTGCAVACLLEATT